MTTTTITPLPRDDRSNGWSALLGARQPRAALEGDVQVDWLVIGAGYAGLAAARQLAQQQPGASVALVEAGVVGENAAGRNAGFAVDLSHTTTLGAGQVDMAKRVMRVNRFALHALDALVRTHRIACDWQASGRYHVAVTEAMANQVLKPYASNLQRWGEPFEWLDRPQLQARLGCDYYSHGLYTPGTVLMNPAALVRGLADSLPTSIRLFEHSPVIEAQLHGAAPWVRTPQGRIRAGGVILAVNAFSQAFGVHRQYQVPVVLFAGLTPELDDAQLARLGSETEWGITPAHGVVGASLRLTGRRLMMRQGFGYAPALRATPAQRTYARRMNLRLLRQRFPQLGDVAFAHFWEGYLAVSRNSAPAFGQIGERAWAVSCCNGSGIVRHTAAGLLIADVATGRENPLIEDFLVQGRACRIPLRPWRDVGLWLTLARQKWQGRHER